MKIFDDIIRKTAEAVVEKAIKEFKAENLLRIPTMAEEGDLMLREYYTNGKWENEIHSGKRRIKVYSPEKLATDSGNPMVLITSTYDKEIISQLEEFAELKKLLSI